MAKADKRSPKEASELFHNIMKASVSEPKQKNKEMETKKKIQSALKEYYRSDESFITRIEAIVDLVTKKYPDLSELQIKESIGNMEGWERIGDGLEDKAEITPSFFKEIE